MHENTLYYGDNLDILRRHIDGESVDLVYLDPPFNSNATYNVLFAEQNGSQAAAQIKAFGDTWRWDEAAARAYQETVEQGGDVARALRAFRMYLGDSNVLAYLAMMAPRLVELRRVLKSTGSIYLHCDPTASHYLKMLMDAAFGPKHFRNEIVWHYAQGIKSSTRKFLANHDVILFYVRSSEHIFVPQVIPYTEEQLSRFKHEDSIGRFYFDTRRDKDNRKKRVRVHLKKQGTPTGDTWYFGRAQGKERLGYPTQKPEALLERIISASSKEGDVLLDPFCGCGTAVEVAERLNRRWIGVDITHLAITLIKHRIQDAFGDQIEYQVIGEPTSLPDAQTLAAEDPYQFQWWALGLVGARPVEQKKGSDKGIDGRLYFHEGTKDKTKQVILSVKAGHTGAAHIRDLRGVIERETAEIGVLITMQQPTQAQRTEAAGAGFYESPWGKHPRLQILTIAELLAGHRIDMPPLRQVSTTFKKAPKAKRDQAQTRRMDLE